MTAQTPAEAVHNANATGSCEVGYCLQYVRTWWEVGPLYASAIEAWNGARHKHPGDRTPPYAAPVFYAGGTYGHIALSNGDGTISIRSTDCTYAGDVSTVALSWPETAWGDSYLGWTSDLNATDLPLTTEDDADMPLSEHDLDKIAARVWSHLVGPEGDQRKAGMLQYNGAAAQIWQHDVGPEGDQKHAGMELHRAANKK